MAHSSVPEFGNWDNQDNVPYTVYFEKARKNRGGKMINPNDPPENRDMLTTANSSPPVPPSNIRKSPARSENVGQKMANDSNHVGRGARSGGPPRMTNDSNNVGRGARSGGPPRRSAGSENSIERSPVHPHQTKYTGRGSQGSQSLAWDGKNSYDGSRGTPGRARPKPVSQGDESPDGSAAIPAFGEWDENDPQSAENFTHIFNKVREEKNNGTGNASGTPKHPSYGAQNQPAKSRKTRCFPWC